MKKFRDDRLLKLADYLMTVSKERFSMSCWAAKTSCGTVCCAVGHACDIPEFKKAGLRLVRGFFNCLVPFYKDKVDFYAAAAFFGLTVKESLYLFDKFFYTKVIKEDISQRTVVRRIRQFVKEKRG